MIRTAVACFVGCFAVMVVLSELATGWPWAPPRPPGRWLRLLGALLIGVIVTVVLSWVLQWAAGVLSHATL